MKVRIPVTLKLRIKKESGMSTYSVTVKVATTSTVTRHDVEQVIGWRFGLGNNHPGSAYGKESPWITEKQYTFTGVPADLGYGVFVKSLIELTNGGSYVYVSPVFYFNVPAPVTFEIPAENGFEIEIVME